MSCVHFQGPESTLRLLHTGGIGVTFWYVECTECGECTDFCLTEDEAIERARVGWWRKESQTGKIR